MIHFEDASRKQLLQIALFEDCEIDMKYEACRELQLRWTGDMLVDLVRLYGKGLTFTEIAAEIGLDSKTVRNKLIEYGIYKKRVGA